MSIQIDNTNAGTITLKPASSGSYSLIFPAAVAAVNGYVLSSDTNGTLSWSASAGGGSTLPITKLQAQSFGGF
jgi:hypothetical protein